MANGALQAASRSQDATDEEPAGIVSPEEGAWLSLLALLLAHAGDARLIRDGDGNTALHQLARSGAKAALDAWREAVGEAAWEGELQEAGADGATVASLL